MDRSLVGRGYDSISGLLKADCVQFQEAHQPPAAVEEVLYSSELVSSAADIVADTQVEAGASLNIGIFSTSMAMSYAQNVKLTSFDAAMLARAVVQDRWQIATSQRLKRNLRRFQGRLPWTFARDVVIATSRVCYTAALSWLM